MTRISRILKNIHIVQLALTVWLGMAPPALMAIQPVQMALPSSWGNPAEWWVVNDKCLLLDRESTGAGQLRLIDPQSGNLEWSHAIADGVLMGNAFRLHQVEAQIVIEVGLKSRPSAYEPTVLKSYYWLNKDTHEAYRIDIPQFLSANGLVAGDFTHKATLFYGEVLVSAGSLWPIASQNRSENVILGWRMTESGPQGFFHYALPGLQYVPILAFQLPANTGDAPALVTVDGEVPDNPVDTGAKHFTFRTFRLQQDNSWIAEGSGDIPLPEVDAKVHAHLPSSLGEGIVVFPSYRAGGNLFSITYLKSSLGWQQPTARDYTPRGGILPVEPGLALLSVNADTYKLTETANGWQSIRISTHNLFSSSLFQTRFSPDRIVARSLADNQLWVFDLIYRGEITDPWFKDRPIQFGYQSLDWLGSVWFVPPVDANRTWAYHPSTGWILIHGHDPAAFWAYDPFAGFVHYQPGSWAAPDGSHFVYMARIGNFIAVKALGGGRRQFFDQVSAQWIHAVHAPELPLANSPINTSTAGVFDGIEFLADGSFRATTHDVIDGETATITWVGSANYTIDPIFPSIASLELSVEFLWILVQENEIQLTIQDVASIIDEPVPQSLTIQLYFETHTSGRYVFGGTLTDGQPISVQHGSF
jgi:hypothetical protein